MTNIIITSIFLFIAYIIGLKHGRESGQREGWINAGNWYRYNKHECWEEATKQKVYMD